eukprot:SAG31_NODE_1695_length_7508_cov_2.975030_6_plen_198_part_00
MGDLLVRLRARIGEESGNMQELEELEDDAQWQSFVCLQELEDLEQGDEVTEQELAAAEQAWNEANRWLRFVREQMVELGGHSAAAQNALWLLGQGKREATVTEEETIVVAVDTGNDQEADCIDCIARKDVEATGNDQLEDCIDCVAGQYVEASGSDEAADCIDCCGGLGHGGRGSSTPEGVIEDRVGGGPMKSPLGD